MGWGTSLWMNWKQKKRRDRSHAKSSPFRELLQILFYGNSALEAALEALRPGGVLSAILYSGKVIGSDEKTEILQWMRSRPLKQCTALVCSFANWADTAPLPCFLLKK